MLSMSVSISGDRSDWKIEMSFWADAKTNITFIPAKKKYLDCADRRKFISNVDGS